MPVALPKWKQLAMQTNFTATLGTDILLRFFLQRDGVDVIFGSTAKVRFTIAGVGTLSNEGNSPRINIMDALDNEANIDLRSAFTAGITPGRYGAEIIVKLGADDEQCVWSGEINFRERLTPLIA